MVRTQTRTSRQRHDGAERSSAEPETFESSISKRSQSCGKTDERLIAERHLCSSDFKSAAPSRRRDGQPLDHHATAIRSALLLRTLRCVEGPQVCKASLGAPGVATYAYRYCTGAARTSRYVSRRELDLIQ